MGPSALDITNAAVILLFGIYISAAFVGVDIESPRNNIALLVLAVFCGALEFWCGAVCGDRAVLGVYPLIVHLPLIALLVLFFRKGIVSSTVSVFIAYLCCQIGKWFGIIVLLAGASEPFGIAVRIAVTVASGLLLIRYAARVFCRVLNRRTRDVLIFGTVPTVFYLFDYVSSVYTDMLYSMSSAVMESLAFILCITYLVFVIMYFREIEEKTSAEQLNRLMEIRLTSAEKEVESFQRANEEIVVMRHDMRHHLARIVSYVQNGENEQALSYIQEIAGLAESTAVRRYCGNESVNALLSFYAEKCARSGIEFQAKAVVVGELPCTDVEITAILSNGLDNAYNAVLPLESDRRIDVVLRVTDGRLLLSIANPYATEPTMQDGMPVTGREGHGLGTQSIRTIVERCGGNCQFAVDGRFFRLQVIL